MSRKPAPPPARSLSTTSVRQPASPVVPAPPPVGSAGDGKSRSAAPPSASNKPSLSEDAIRIRAYQKWEAAGSPQGDGRDFWIEAERELSPQRRPSV